MVEALFIFHPRKARAASLLKALLIFRDVTLENMAIWMRLPVEVVTIWADRVSVRMHRHLELTDCPAKKGSQMVRERGLEPISGPFWGF